MKTFHNLFIYFFCSQTLHKLSFFLIHCCVTSSELYFSYIQEKQFWNNKPCSQRLTCNTEVDKSTHLLKKSSLLYQFNIHILCGRFLWITKMRGFFHFTESHLAHRTKSKVELLPSLVFRCVFYCGDDRYGPWVVPIINCNR